ncbi:MAG: DUF3592 domain-containing protein [Lachnospiraceae bacterium]|nr:DUF3592 domain-containing protein [Lachnospiraceae bacterium]
MEKENEYRKMVFRRSIRYDIVLLLVLIAAVGGTWLVASVVSFLKTFFVVLAILFSVLFVGFVALLINYHIKVRTWPIAAGTVEEVYLDDPSGQPTSSARVRYEDKDGNEYVREWGVSSYGDWEDGCEQKVAEMLQADRDRFEGAGGPVFYSSKNPDKCLIMLEDFTKNG